MGKSQKLDTYNKNKKIFWFQYQEYEYEVLSSMKHHKTIKKKKHMRKYYNGEKNSKLNYSKATHTHTLTV